MSKDFFVKRSDGSRVKGEIVIKFYDAWTNIMLNKFPNEDLSYVDLYCGPGIYDDGNWSVPLKLMDHVLKNNKLSQKMRFYFNDKNEEYIENLKSNIQNLQGIDKLLSRIRFNSETIDLNFAKRWSTLETPTLSFLDPCGYKGLTLDLIQKLMTTRGSDCIFFFNFNRVKMGVWNDKVIEHLESIFGVDKTVELRVSLKDQSPGQREITILTALIEALKGIKCDFVQPFKFPSLDKSRTSHYIVYVTKNETGFMIMKDIMHKYSIKDQDNVAMFEFDSDVTPDWTGGQLSFFSRLDDLCSHLKENFAGTKIKIEDLCKIIVIQDSSLFVRENVKDALRKLEEKNIITVEGRKKKTKNGKATMPDKAFVVFRN